MATTALLDLQLKPDSLDSAYKALHETLDVTRARPGNLGVTVLIDAGDPAHVLVVETWESIEADEAYRAWRATPEGASDLGSILAGRPGLSQFTVAGDI